jgi:hypothetical protein
MASAIGVNLLVRRSPSLVGGLNKGLGLLAAAAATNQPLLRSEKNISHIQIQIHLRLMDLTYTYVIREILLSKSIENLLK